ncbi:hypothetical protein EsDP_00007416 [Epichloe bromicola]|uniref:Beta-lactamase-related domain-containing protein n=1 Tax=Epichloe bromicola TaxID=79588 RepID=A0ABQ0D0J5_9HYPO
MADTVNGSCDPAFNRVRDLLQEKLTSGEELGASLCVSVDGKNVLDLWGGHADAEKSRPWEEDTVTVVWSCSKVVTALAGLTLIDRGLLDPEERVSKYWPEFGVNGKEDIKVWHIFSHSSGLCTWEKPVTVELLLDTPASTVELAKQAPLFEPGSASGYQMQTHGHLIGELVRRISGKPLKQFIADEIAGPLDAKISETPAFRAADVGASNGFANARALARIGSLVSLKGTVDGKQYLAPKTVDQMVQESISGVDLVLGLNLRIGLGVGLPVPNLSFIPEGNIAFWGGWEDL